MKWYTCTPVAFRGDESFFERDSGLWCRSLRQIGIESRAVMPLPGSSEDAPDLLRVEPRLLQSASWWHSLGIDGVILYSWGLPRFTPVARAIRKAGLKLIVYLDSNGEMYPWRQWRGGTALMRDVLVHRFGPWAGSAAFAAKMVYAHIAKPWVFNLRQRSHLALADRIGLPLPHAMEVYRSMRFLYGPAMDRLVLMPAPVSGIFHRSAAAKEDLVACIGRWDDDFAKRPRLMMKCVQQVGMSAPSVRFVLCGQGTPELRAWLEGLPQSLRERVEWRGYVPHHQLPELLNRASIVLCTSRSESTHFASAEGLCCGCSVVSPGHYGLEAIRWYASEASGTIARSDAPEALAEALLAERDEWIAGRRNPERIARIWGSRLHAVSTLRRLFSHEGFGLAPEQPMR